MSAFSHVYSCHSPLTGPGLGLFRDNLSDSLKKYLEASKTNTGETRIAAIAFYSRNKQSFNSAAIFQNNQAMQQNLRKSFRSQEMFHQPIK